MSSKWSISLQVVFQKPCISAVVCAVYPTHLLVTWALFEFQVGEVLCGAVSYQLVPVEVKITCVAHYF